MEVGDKIIWHSGFGYDYGYYSNDQGVTYDTVEINLITGMVHGEMSVPQNEVLAFNQENYDEIINRYSPNRYVPENFAKEINLNT